MQPDCTSSVRAGLDAVEALRTLPGRFSEFDPAEERIVQTLAALPEDCSSELGWTAERLLDAMPDAEEGDLWVVLGAVQRRHQADAARLIVRAMEHPATGLKEWYAALLDDLGREDLVVPTLVHALDAGLRGTPRADASLIIRALHSRRAGEALAAVRPYVAHADVSARGAALGFLWDYDDSGATDLLVGRLHRETDPDLLAVVIDTLLALDCRGAVPALRAFGHDQRRPRDLREAATAAAEELAARESG
jgi:hypothetical protein